METLYKFFFEFISDKNRQLPAKLLTVIGILGCVYLVNDLFGFTYYYNTKNKIEQLKDVNEVLRDSTLSLDVKSQIYALRGRLLKRKNVIERTVNYASGKYNSLRIYLAGRSLKKIIKPEGEVVESQSIPERNNLLFLLSGAGVAVMMALLFIPVSLYIGIDQGLVTGVSAFIMLVGGCSLYAWFTYLILSLIPPLLNVWTWNYVVNLIFQCVVLFCLLILVVRAGKKNK